MAPSLRESPTIRRRLGIAAAALLVTAAVAAASLSAGSGGEARLAAAASDEPTTTTSDEKVETTTTTTAPTTTTEPSTTTTELGAVHAPTPGRFEATEGGLRVVVEVTDLAPLVGQPVTATISYTDDDGRGETFVLVLSDRDERPIVVMFPVPGCTRTESKRPSELTESATFSFAKPGPVAAVAHVGTGQCSPSEKVAINFEFQVSR